MLVCESPGEIVNRIPVEGLRIDFGVSKDCEQVVGIEGAGHAFAFGAAFESLFLAEQADGESAARLAAPWRSC
jgi:hypothetical protein